MKHFCCDRLHVMYSGEKTMGLNIRVLRLSDDLMRKSQGRIQFNKSVMLTEGYAGTIDNCDKKILINFCPFCGSSLDYMKQTDVYVQEDIGL